MEIRTHLKIDQRLSGKPISLEEGKAKVELKTIEEMAADEKGLVHGGFIFSLADYSAMLAVNEPTVVLAGASVKFLKPVKVGDTVVAEAEVKKEEGKKRWVDVVVKKGEEVVFTGEFFCVVPPKHVLD
ncbi:MAG: PaaI family thioesterase [Thermodesulfobacteria bacterium]|nr:PaaI family thioesterase [Thermodesulfobacteriota bacterium]